MLDAQRRLHRIRFSLSYDRTKFGMRQVNTLIGCLSDTHIARFEESRSTKKLKVDFKSVPYNHSVRPRTVCEDFVPGQFAKISHNS